jgi:hypothetical protein
VKRALLLLVLAGCLGPQDDPSQVHDLRVIATRFDPPEIMAPSCAGLIGGGGLGGVLDGGVMLDAGMMLQPPNLLALAAFAQPIQMKWLVLDPQERDISYDLRACADPSDLTCDSDGGWVEVQSGTMKPGTLALSSPIGASFLTGSIATFLSGDGGQPLLFAVVQNDPYKGLGGFRMPVVLHVTAGDEQVFAQKLMVYSCRFFDDQKANVQPIIPGLSVMGDEWPESLDGGPTRSFSLGNGQIEMDPDDFSALEEDYVVPSFALKPVHLHESWKFSWFTSLGRFSPTTSGGTDFTGAVSRPRSNWLPRLDGGTAALVETDVDFWIVVRDGRGGESWIERKAHFTP